MVVALADVASPCSGTMLKSKTVVPAMLSTRA
jgi:hypothetical protein